MTIRRWHLTLIAGLFVLALCSALRPAEAGSPAPSPAFSSASELAIELAQGGNIMQCMEQCIRSEGKAEKDTCKSRCAGMSSQAPKQKDCMGTYKKCQHGCQKRDRDCLAACKQALMSCS